MIDTCFLKDKAEEYKPSIEAVIEKMHKFNGAEKEDIPGNLLLIIENDESVIDLDIIINVN